MDRDIRAKTFQTIDGENMKEPFIYTPECSLGQQSNSLKVRGRQLCEDFKRSPALGLLACEAVRVSRGLRTGSAKEMAARGLFPGIAPFGYLSNAEGVLAIDPVESRIVSRIFDLCVSGNQGPLSISTSIRVEYGVHLGKRSIRLILEDCFYVGVFAWRKRWYSGVHPVFIPHGLFYQSQAILKGLDSGMSQ